MGFLAREKQRDGEPVEGGRFKQPTTVAYPEDLVTSLLLAPRMCRMARTRPGSRLWLALGLILAAGPARADDYTWTNTSGGNWGTADNWSGGVVPGVADNAFLTTA